MFIYVQEESSKSSPKLGYIELTYVFNNVLWFNLADSLAPQRCSPLPSILKKKKIVLREMEKKKKDKIHASRQRQFKRIEKEGKIIIIIIIVGCGVFALEHGFLSAKIHTCATIFSLYW